jgi:hypothetical protein
MKIAVLYGVAIIGAASPVMPAAAAQDCSAIIKSLNSLSGEISNQADNYWAQRKAYIKHRSTASAGGATSPNVQAAQQRADSIKGVVPKNLASFAGLLAAAKEQKCLTPEEIKALQETAFNAGRAVNFDELPTSETTEGIPSARQTPRMPEK